MPWPGHDHNTDIQPPLAKIIQICRNRVKTTLVENIRSWQAEAAGRCGGGRESESRLGRRGHWRVLRGSRLHTASVKNHQSLDKTRTGNLDHVKPADRILVTAFHGLERAVVSADSSLRRQTAHPQEHVQNVGKTLRLVVVVRRTLVEGPLNGC